MSRVYFIRPVGLDGPVKVGCSVSPDNRRQTLENWSPFPLEIIAEIDGDYELERCFHALFVETHLRREWFGWSRRIAATVAAINDGTFNPATLPRPLKVSHLVAGAPVPHPRRGWSQAAKFSVSYTSRMHALHKRGMPWSVYCGGPSVHSYSFSRADPDDQCATISECEAFADEMTAKYGHKGLKPVRWQGPYPSVSATMPILSVPV